MLREPTQVVLNWDFLRARIPESTGTPHIHYLGGDELLAVETRFSTACGCGPVHVRDNRSRIANVEVADEEEEEEEKEEEEGKDNDADAEPKKTRKKQPRGEEAFDAEADTNVTGFSCDAAALDKASQLLERQQHPKRRAKRAKKIAELEAEEKKKKKKPPPQRQRAGDFSYAAKPRRKK